MTLTWPDYLTEADGELRFSGSRVGPVEILHFYKERGYSAEMLALEFPSVSLLTLHKFIAFYLEHAGEIDAFIATEQEQLERLRASSPHHVSPGELRKRPGKAQQVSPA